MFPKRLNQNNSVDYFKKNTNFVDKKMKNLYHTESSGKISIKERNWNKLQ